MPQTRRPVTFAIIACVVVAACIVVAVRGCNTRVDSTEGKGGNLATSKMEKKVGIVYTAPHIIINEIVDGFKDQLAKDYPGRVTIVERHASGDASQFSSTVNSVLSEGVDIIVPITTPIAQNALKQAPDAVSICFLGITDPIGAGLVSSLDKPIKSTGVSDLAPFGKTLELIQALMPQAKTVGYPYNPEDQAAVFGLSQVKLFAPKYGLTIMDKAIVSKDELLSLFDEVVRNSDCTMIGSDNLMFEAAPTLVKVGIQAKKPVFAADSTSIQSGAIGGYTINYRQVGTEGAGIVARILEGKKAGDIPVITIQDGFLELNLKSADLFGVKLSEELISRAKTVHKP